MTPLIRCPACEGPVLHTEDGVPTCVATGHPALDFDPSAGWCELTDPDGARCLLAAGHDGDHVA